MSENKTSENKRDYEVGRGKPPVHSRFEKGQSGNPRGPSPKNLAVLLVEALNEKAVVNHRRQAPRDHQARGGRHATGQQIDRCGFARDQDADRHAEGRREKKAGVTQPFAAADEEVMATFVARLRQSWEEELRERGTENAGSPSNGDARR